jgi:hypothetical protein
MEEITINERMIKEIIAKWFGSHFDYDNFYVTLGTQKDYNGVPQTVAKISIRGDI